MGGGKCQVVLEWRASLLFLGLHSTHHFCDLGSGRVTR